MNNKRTIEVLELAIEILETQGWCQGAETKFVLYFGRLNYCVVGALRSAGLQLGNLNAFLDAVSELNSHLNDTFGADSFLCVPDWNDEKGRTKYEVIDALKHTVKNLENTK